MLGIGIFLTPSIVVQNLGGASWLFFMLWVLCGAIALSGAVAYAELGAMLPRAGGDYVFLREAYDSSTAFASGWVIFGAVFTGSIAALAVPLCQYQLPVLIEPVAEALGTKGPAWKSLWFGLPLERWIACVIVVVLTAVNAWVARISAWLQNATTLIPMVVFAIGALWAIGVALWDPSTLAVPEVTKALEPPRGIFPRVCWAALR